jgi:hypothetical protein
MIYAVSLPTRSDLKSYFIPLAHVAGMRAVLNIPLSYRNWRDLVDVHGWQWHYLLARPYKHVDSEMKRKDFSAGIVTSLLQRSCRVSRRSILLVPAKEGPCQPNFPSSMYEATREHSPM